MHLNLGRDGYLKRAYQPRLCSQASGGIRPGRNGRLGALQGSDTTTEAIPGGGTRIVVQARRCLCELRFRTRSAFAGESIQASRRTEHRLWVV